MLAIPALRTLPLVVVLTAAVSAAGSAAETAADAATRGLLEALEELPQERQMPDVTLAVLARVESDPEASAGLKREAAFRRSAALVELSTTEADSGRRAQLLDDAQASLDAFLKSGAPDGREAIAAYTQKGRLLRERGRVKARQAARPGVDAKTIQAEAAKFFDEALVSLRGTAKPGEAIAQPTNAEDAVLKVLRELDARIAAIEGPTKQGEPAADQKSADGKPVKQTTRPRLTIQQRRELETLEKERDALRGKLIQTRLDTAMVVFEKAGAFPEKSPQQQESLAASAAMFKQIADKYPSYGGGLLARCYEGRSYALLGKWKEAIDSLSPLTLLDDREPLVILLRARAGNTYLECLLAQKQYDKFDAALRKFALEDVARLPGAKLDADWLGFKYRAAKILDAQADALDPKDPKSRGELARLQADAKKLAFEVTKAKADFATEARELAAKLGKVVAEGERTFAAAFDEANLALQTMQGHAVALKESLAANDNAKAATARQAAAVARAETVAKLTEALTLAGITKPLEGDPADDEKLAGGVSIDDVNQCRYLLAYLLYEEGRFAESAALGRMLAERYPNAKGSRQAAKIALAAWQQAGRQAAGEARQEARNQAAELAAIVMKTWPEESESADAAVIAISAAVSARDPQAIIEVIGQVPATSPRRTEVLLRAGVALWREVQETQRLEERDRPEKALIAGWRAAAARALDDGLAGLGGAAAFPPPPLGPLAAQAAIARVQIALEDGDIERAKAALEHPVFGPWTLVAGDKPVLADAGLTKAALTLGLRVFIQTKEFDKAQQAMDGLERAAGGGEGASNELTAMYTSMGRDLQRQLESLADAPADAQKILQGFEIFLDRVAARDQKISSQMWVATTYLTLGSGKNLGAIVPPARAAAYRQKAAGVYQNLLAKKDLPDVAKFEPSIRLKMAIISKELADWDQARKQVDWLLSDPKRQNSLDVQILAAEVLEGAGQTAAKAGNTAEAEQLFREAAAGRKDPPPVVIWGWSNIANKLARQGIDDAGDKQRQNRNTFFEARFKAAECQLARARLPGKEKNRDKRLETAELTIVLTRNSYPDLGGEASARRYEQLLMEVQRERGKQPDGFRALDAQPAQAAPANATP